MASKRQLEDALHDRTVEACARCGMPRDVWPDDAWGGAVRDGVIYCCKGCADGTGCTCTGSRVRRWAARAPTKAEIRHDPDSAAFLNEHRKENKTIEPEEYGDAMIEKGGGTNASHD